MEKFCRGWWSHNTTIYLSLCASCLQLIMLLHFSLGFSLKLEHVWSKLQPVFSLPGSRCLPFCIRVRPHTLCVIDFYFCEIHFCEIDFCFHSHFTDEETEVSLHCIIIVCPFVCLSYYIVLLEDRDTFPVQFVWHSAGQAINIYRMKKYACALSCNRRKGKARCKSLSVQS